MQINRNSRINTGSRWGVEHKPIGSRAWILFFTVCTMETANKMLFRVCSSAGGDFRFRHARKGAT